MHGKGRVGSVPAPLPPTLGFAGTSDGRGEGFLGCQARVAAVSSGARLPAPLGSDSQLSARRLPALPVGHPTLAGPHPCHSPSQPWPGPGCAGCPQVGLGEGSHSFDVQPWVPGAPAHILTLYCPVSLAAAFTCDFSSSSLQAPVWANGDVRYHCFPHHQAQLPQALQAVRGGSWSLLSCPLGRQEGLDAQDSQFMGC